MVRIFASSFYGFDPEKWGAFSFRDRGTRDRLLRELTPDDLCLQVITAGTEPPPELRGRAVALIKVGAFPQSTRELVDPEWMLDAERRYGVDRWPYALPILAADRFIKPPLVNYILPRIRKQNLAVPMARHYVELEPAEVAAVLAIDRKPLENIYFHRREAFARHRLGTKPGPPPALGTRTLSQKSGPAAIYVLQLTGARLSIFEEESSDSKLYWFKIGFSKRPQHRLSCFNSYFPFGSLLMWTLLHEDWFDDEISAYAMEQAVHAQLQLDGATRVQGEIFRCSREVLSKALDMGLKTAVRPIEPVIVSINE